MPVCDVCNKSINWSDGYVLSTRQVAASEAYWEFAFTHQWAYAHNMDPGGATVAMLVQQQAGQSTGWLVCETCSNLFSFDRHTAKELAMRQSSAPPGGGPASVQEVASAAGRAWKKLYGKWPSSIRVVEGSPGARSTTPGEKPRKWWQFWK
jgi:hypothetical protein